MFLSTRVASGQYNWDQLIDGTNLPDGVILLSTTDSIACPAGVGFTNEKCFSVTFDGSNLSSIMAFHWCI